MDGTQECANRNLVEVVEAMGEWFVRVVEDGQELTRSSNWNPARWLSRKVSGSAFISICLCGFRQTLTSRRSSIAANDGQDLSGDVT